MIQYPTKAEIKVMIEAMTPEERKAFVKGLCQQVDNLATAIVEDADEIWESRDKVVPKLH